MSLSRERQRPLAVVVFFTGLLAVFVASHFLGPAQKALAAGKTFDGLDLQLAWTGARASAILQAWAPPLASQPSPLLAAARQSLHRDFGLIAAYVLALTGFWWWLKLAALRALTPMEDPDGRSRRFFHRAMWLAAAGGALDVVENVFLLAELRRHPQPIPGWMAALASTAATGKWLLTVVPVVMALIVLARLAMQGAFRRRKDPEHRVDLATVRQSESAYLAGRREKAGQAATESERGWIGLAFSGGGIRAATTSLGALQTLTARGLLPFVDYLSTVSGGGYFGSAFSSLLSINAKKMVDSPRGEKDQYVFAPGDEPFFSTARNPTPFAADPDAEPFGTERFDGRAEVRHLRTHGDFLVLRKRWIHRDVLRAVGNVMGGLFFHWGIVLVASLAIVSLYLTLLYLMVGDLRSIAPANYWEQVTTFHNLRHGPQSPWLAAFATGASVFLVGLGFCGWLVWSLPRKWLQRPGESVDDAREFHCLWALFFLTLTTALVFTARVVGTQGAELAMITLPLFVYLGGTGVGLLAHWLVGVWPTFGRNERSRFAAWKGIYNYLTAASLVFLLFPWVIEWVVQNPDLSRFESGGVGAWLASSALTWFLAHRGQKSPGGNAMTWLKKAVLAGSTIRNLILGVLVTVLVVLTWLLIAVFLVEHERKAGLDPLTWRVHLLLLSAGVGVLAGFLFDFNRLSLHYFYRDRLAETYLQSYCNLEATRALDIERDNAEMPLSHLHGVPQETGAAPAQPTAVAPVTASPLHLVVATLNLTRARDLKRRNRKSDSFVFSKLYCGSQTTGYLDTRFYRGGETKLARAVTISGAAASTAMGRNTFFAQSFAATVFNVRLGQWMENPAFRGGSRTHRREGWVFWPKYLIQEMLAATDAGGRLVHLSDGGHSGDNLGLYPLFLRRCRLILAVDAEADPIRGFGSLTEVLRQARIDQGIEVELDLGTIHPDRATGLSKRPFAIGRIHYPTLVREDKSVEVGREEASSGWLLVLKNTLTGEESEMIRNYRLENATFPHETTGDQFFDDAQFEAYRELGARGMERALGAELKAELVARGWLDDWQRDFPQLPGMVP